MRGRSRSARGIDTAAAGAVVDDAAGADEAEGAFESRSLGFLIIYVRKRCMVPEQNTNLGGDLPFTLGAISSTFLRTDVCHVWTPIACR